MAGSSDSLHEDPGVLGPEAVDRHRAIVSIMEELEAVDWYDQRARATHDAELGEILAHNRDEEKEHAAMTLEWLRRRDAGWDEKLRTYLFTDIDILDVEERAEHGGGADGNGDGAGAGAGTRAGGSLGIGSLRDEESL